MKPAPLSYHAPRELDEALDLLDRLQGEDAKVLAGGQSLMPLVNMRLARPRHMVDINRVAGLDGIRVDDDGAMSFGTLVRHRALEHSPVVAERLPILAEVAPLIGDRIVRFRGTFGGSIVHADPAAELPAVAAALDAQFVLRTRSGTRSVSSDEFFVTYLTTAIEPDEMLVEVRIPPLPSGTGQAFLELTRQHGAFAIVGVAACLSLADGHIADARLGLAGVGGRPVRARAAEAALRGQSPSVKLFSEAGQIAAGECDPDGDVHGSAEYRREMAAVYTRRTLQVAASRAGWSE